MSECPDSNHKENAVRCLCNRLVFIVKGENIEIKCGRCKRIAVIRTNGIQNITFE